MTILPNTSQPERCATALSERAPAGWQRVFILLFRSHRAFGCLYGVERYGGNPVAYVPRNVAIASGIQKLFSAVFIFLFGLAVRNISK
jgi:hypothetical protein